MQVPHLEQWVAEGFIRADQAAQIERYEADLDHVPESARSQRGRVVAEVIGSLGAIGAAVATVVGTVVLWDDLTTPARIAVPVIGALVLVAAGAVLPRDADASTTRLGALLWLLGIGASAAAVAIAGTELADWAPQTAALCSGLVVVALSVVLTPLRPEPHLVVTLGGGLTAATVGLVGRYEHASGVQYGAALMAVGLGLMLFAWAGRLASEGTGYLAGGAIAFVGVELLNDVGPYWPIIVGMAIGVTSLVIFIVVRHRALLMVGLVYAVVFIVQGIVVASERDRDGRGGGSGVVLVAFAIGVTLLAGALFALRGRRGTRTGR